MDMYKVKWTALQRKVFRFLSIKVGEKVNQRGIARALNVSPTAIANSLKDLEKRELLKVRKEPKMNLTLIELNRENQKAIELKKIENLTMIYESELVNLLEDKFPGTTIILFGSYAKGEDTITSDMDIAIIGTKEKQIDLDRFNELFEREIILNFYTSWKEINRNLRNNILNGLILAGGINL